jgi:hypothetical protein
MMCAFGIGLSWGLVLLNMHGYYNGGIEVYKIPNNLQARKEMIEHYIKYFQGE